MTDTASWEGFWSGVLLGAPLGATLGAILAHRLTLARERNQRSRRGMGWAALLFVTLDRCSKLYDPEGLTSLRSSLVSLQRDLAEGHGSEVLVRGQQVQLLTSLQGLAEVLDAIHASLPAASGTAFEDARNTANRIRSRLGSIVAKSTLEQLDSGHGCDPDS